MKHGVVTESTILLAVYTLTMPAHIITMYVFLTNHTHTHMRAHAHITNSILPFPSSTTLYEEIDDLILDDLFMDIDTLPTTNPMMEEIPHHSTKEQPSPNHPISPIEAGKHRLRALTNLKIPIIHPRLLETTKPLPQQYVATILHYYNL